MRVEVIGADRPWGLDSRVVLVADGREICSLAPAQEVYVSQAAHTARLIYLDDKYFFHNLSEKLSW